MLLSHYLAKRLIGAAGRTPTRIVPIRSRMPHVFGHGSVLKWSERQDFHLRPPGPKPGALKTELRSEKMADPKGLAPSAFPQTTGCSSDLATGPELVGNAGNAPVVASNSYFVTSDLQSGGWINSHGGPAQAVVAGVGVAPTEAELMRLA